jgi:phosphatidylserine/phosphatidylglycerophosphate/cardiolipin synthase-like enzyme
LLRRMIKQSEKPTLESEATARPQWRPRSWQGLVIRAIVQSGRPLTWREIQEATGLGKKSLNRALFELISSEDIYKIESNTNAESKYNISDERFQIYSELYNPKTELVKWIAQWKEIRNLDFSIEHEHFFLERRHLDDFSKELISHAKFDVLIANPYIQDCDLSNTLIEASKNGINVQIITRPPEDKHPEYLKKKQEYHSKLKQEGISLFYDAKVHAKLIVVDSAIAAVSSMNFYADSSAGVSWEAGLVSTNQKVVNSIANAFSKVLANTSKVSGKADIPQSSEIFD